MTDAQWQRWLERSGKHRCVLVELTFLGAAVGSPSASQEYHAYVSNMAYVSRASDTPANQIFDQCVIEAPSFTRRMGEQLEGRSTQSYGDLILANPYTLDAQGEVLVAGVRDAWLSMNWDGRQYRMWLGDPAWPFADFRLVQDGRLVDVFDPGGYKIGFKISDKAALLNRPVMTTLLGGDGPDADKLMPYALGNSLINVAPKLIDVITQAYRITAVDYAGIVERLDETGGVAAGVTAAEDGNPLQDLTHDPVTSVNTATDLLTSVGHGFFENSRLEFFDTGAGLAAPLAASTDYWVIASGLTADDFKVSATKGGAAVNLTTNPGAFGVSVRSVTMDYPNGGFTLAGNPAGLITCSTAGLRVGGGADIMYSPGDLINQALTSGLTNTPLSSADIDAANFAAHKALLGVGKQVSYDLTEQITFSDLFDKLMLSGGGWWGFSRDGLLQLGRLDLPVAGTPAYSFINDDVARRSMKLLRRILPRAEVKLLADRNWTVQSVFAEAVSQYDRGIYSKAGIEYLGAPTITSWDTDPASHRNAVYPDVFETFLSLGGQAEATRLATLFQYPTAVFGFQTHQAVYLLNLGSLIYVDSARFTGYGIVVGLTERVKGRCEVEFFAQLPDVYPTADIA